MWFVLILGMLFSMTASASGQQPYAGLQARELKALSAQQIDDLRHGRGMGMASAAELNGYPGPVHVLQLANSLGLDAAQRTRVTTLVDAMKAEAVPLGERLIAHETELDQHFADKSITATKLDVITASIAAVKAQLRAAHLKYHLLTLEVLSDEQARQYAVLRGYGDGAGQGRQHRH